MTSTDKMVGSQDGPDRLPAITTYVSCLQQTSHAVIHGDTRARAHALARSAADPTYICLHPPDSLVSMATDSRLSNWAGKRCATDAGRESDSIPLPLPLWR